MALVMIELASVMPSRGEPGLTTIYFFSPEITVSSFNTLKAAFDGVLAPCGNYAFQPVARRADFEALLAKQESALFLMSSTHYRELDDRMRLTPRLVGIRDAKIVQEHGLYTLKANGGVSSLRGATVAISGPREYAANLLRDMLRGEEPALADSINFLVVPKQVDALMAVSFGSATAALATESSVRRLAEINPRQAASLKLAASSAPILLPILVSPSDANASTKALLDVLSGLQQQPAGLQCLRMLGLDGMTELPEAEKEELGR